MTQVVSTKNGKGTPILSAQDIYTGLIHGIKATKSEVELNRELSKQDNNIQHLDKLDSKLFVQLSNEIEAHRLSLNPENHAEKGMVQNGQTTPERKSALDRMSMVQILMDLQKRVSEKDIQKYRVDISEKLKSMSPTQAAQFEAVYQDHLKTVQARVASRASKPTKGESVKDLAVRQIAETMLKWFQEANVDNINSLLSNIAKPHTGAICSSIQPTIVTSILRTAIVISGTAEYQTSTGSVEKGDFRNAIKRTTAYIVGFVSEDGHWTFEQTSKDNFQDALFKAFSQSRIDSLRHRCESGQPHKITVKNREYMRFFAPDVYARFFNDDGSIKKG